MRAASGLHVTAERAGIHQGDCGRCVSLSLRAALRRHWPGRVQPAICCCALALDWRDRAPLRHCKLAVWPCFAACRPCFTACRHLIAARPQVLPGGFRKIIEWMGLDVLCVGPTVTWWPNKNVSCGSLPGTTAAPCYAMSTLAGLWLEAYTTPVPVGGFPLRLGPICLPAPPLNLGHSCDWVQQVEINTEVSVFLLYTGWKGLIQFANGELLEICK